MILNRIQSRLRGLKTQRDRQHYPKEPINNAELVTRFNQLLESNYNKVFNELAGVVNLNRNDIAEVLELHKIIRQSVGKGLLNEYFEKVI